MNQHYEIRIKGHLDQRWSEWLAGMTIHHEANGDTLLKGSLADQSALHGVLNRLRDFGIPLISVNPMAEEQKSISDSPG